MSLCAMAPMMPTTIVSRPHTISTLSSSPCGNSSECARMIAYTPTLVSNPAKTAVIGAGAVGYESGSHADSGKTAALMPNATSRTAKMAVRVPGGMLSKRRAMSAMLRVPVAA